jgi:hypothetical protein
MKPFKKVYFFNRNLVVKPKKFCFTLKLRLRALTKLQRILCLRKDLREKDRAKFRLKLMKKKATLASLKRKLSTINEALVLVTAFFELAELSQRHGFDTKTCFFKVKGICEPLYKKI